MRRDPTLDIQHASHWDNLLLQGGRGGHYDRKHCLRVYSLGYHSLLQHIFGHVMAAIGGNSAGPGAPIKVRRPSAYNPSRAATLGPS
ncbi:splicing factor U2af large subunit B-like [Juglans microcarpa x Juglans regia]|uniref:splicing factor U2af large subunit B-like n=1 Tax=Juglans microcarpa x Juglans regia TaxID=2249226 RepID=UPI001B7ECD3E|nr:splicing factor U2af large subunit B-like [Juglans microcarpa x Juglans regia]